MKDTRKFIKDVKVFQIIFEVIKIIFVDLLILFKNLFLPDISADERSVKYNTNGLTENQIQSIKLILGLDLNINSIIKSRESIYVNFINYNDISILEKKIDEIKKRIIR